MASTESVKEAKSVRSGVLETKDSKSLTASGSSSTMIQDKFIYDLRIYDLRFFTSTQGDADVIDVAFEGLFPRVAAWVNEVETTASILYADA